MTPFIVLGLMILCLGLGAITEERKAKKR